MTQAFKNLIKGIRLRDNDDTGIGDISGSLTASDNGSVYIYQQKIKAFLSAAEYEIITNSQTQTLTNKTIDADNNTISNIEVDNLKTGVLDTDLTSVSASDDTLASAKAIRTAIDAAVDTVNDASEINYSNGTSGLTATDVQAAIDEVEGRVDTAESSLSTHTGASTGVHGITGAVVGTTDAQTLTNKTINADNNTISNIDNNEIKAAAGIELSKLAALTANRAVELNASGELIASSVTNTELGYVSGVTSSIQTQLNAKFVDPLTTRGDIIYRDASTTTRLPLGSNGQILKSDGTDIFWDNLAGGGDVVGPASSTDDAIARFDSTTGKLLQNSTVTLSDAGVIASASIDVDNNTVTNIEVDNLKSGVLDTDLTSVSGSDDTLASAKAIKTYVDASTGIGQNLIINGNMDIAQRGTSFAGPAHDDYTIDRWNYYNFGSSAVQTISQNTDVPTLAQSGFLSTYSLDANTTTADATIDAGDFTGFRYNIEGYDFTQVAQKEFTISFWVKATVTGTQSVGFLNDSQNRSYVAEYTINSSDTWEKKEITVPASPSTGGWNYTNGRGLQIFFNMHTGTTFSTATIGSWISSQAFSSSNAVNNTSSTSNIFRIAQVKLEKGSSATEFTRAGANIQDELAMCQRYFQKSQNQGSVPGASGSMVGSKANGTSATGGNWGFTHDCPFYTIMRSSPTVTLYNTINQNTAVIRNDASGAEVSATTDGIQDSFFICRNNAAVVDNVTYKFAWSADSEL